MGKQTIKWHEDCQKNSLDHARRLRADAERKMAEAVEAEARNAFRAEQIAEAKRRGMTEFDSDRLLVKKGQKL